MVVDTKKIVLLSGFQDGLIVRSLRVQESQGMFTLGQSSKEEPGGTQREEQIPLLLTAPLLDHLSGLKKNWGTKLASQDTISEIPVCCEPPACLLTGTAHSPGASFLLSHYAIIHPDTLSPQVTQNTSTHLLRLLLASTTPCYLCSSSSWAPFLRDSSLPAFPSILSSLKKKKNGDEKRVHRRTVSV